MPICTQYLLNVKRRCGNVCSSSEGEEKYAYCWDQDSSDSREVRGLLDRLFVLVLGY